MSRIRLAEQPYLRDDLPDIQVGNTVDVAVKLTEGDRERIQTFSGTVIRIRGSGLGRTFTVRRIVQGEGVERVFPFHAPVIDSIEITRKGRVRRAKLHYLRDRVGKSTRLREVIGARPPKGKGRKARQAPTETPRAADDETTPVEQAASTES